MNRYSNSLVKTWNPTPQDVEVNAALIDYYRCPREMVRFEPPRLREVSGFFRFGNRNVCFGRCTVPVAREFKEPLPDVTSLVSPSGSAISLPFDANEVIENLRAERYATDGQHGGSILKRAAKKSYYALRPILPVSLRKHFQRFHFRNRQQTTFPCWPVDATVDRICADVLGSSIRANGASIPFVWFWPNGYPGCAIVTHDVEHERGKAFCGELMDLDDSYRITSSFQIVPQGRYSVSDAFLESLRTRGFEVNVHDLNHDGHLLDDRDLFLQRTARINRFAQHYHAEGFRAGSMYRNPDWFGALEFAYDMSVPSAAHLEPQSGGCCTVMPYFIGNLVELPLTTTQDYSLFHILGLYSTDLWNQEIEFIRARNGLISFIVHPDYIIDRKARDIYRRLLERLVELRRSGDLWLPLPCEVARWWRDRNRMQVVRSDGRWIVVGPGSERARVAFARRDGDRVTYEIEDTRRVAAA